MAALRKYPKNQKLKNYWFSRPNWPLKLAATLQRNAYSFLFVAKAYITFSHIIWFRNVQTTCLNLYVRYYVVALRNFCMAALHEYPKKPKIVKFLIFTAKLAATLQKNAYSFWFIAKAYITFSHIIWFRNVQTTCINLYVRYYVVALRNFCIAALREYPKNQKLKNYRFSQPNWPLHCKKMHIRFGSLRRHILHFLTEFGFTICRRHVLTYTSDVTS